MARLDHEPGAELVERLVVRAVDARDLHVRAVDVAQRLHVVELEFGVAGNVEMQRAAERDVEHLQAAANGEDRAAAFPARAAGCQIPTRRAPDRRPRSGSGSGTGWCRNSCEISSPPVSSRPSIASGTIPIARVPEAQVGIDGEDLRQKAARRPRESMWRYFSTAKGNPDCQSRLSYYQTALLSPAFRSAAILLPGLDVFEVAAAPFPVPSISARICVGQSAFAVNESISMGIGLKQVHFFAREGLKLHDILDCAKSRTFSSVVFAFITK